MKEHAGKALALLMAVGISCSTAPSDPTQPPAPETTDPISVPDVPAPPSTTAPRSSDTSAHASSTTTSDPIQTSHPPSAEMELEDLEEPVVVYGPSEELGLTVLSDGERTALYGGPVMAVLPDGRGGLLAQTAADRIVWLEAVDGGDPVTIAESDRQLELRAVLPDGRVLYSERPAEADIGEASVEDFYSIDPQAPPAQERVASAPALETRTVGPAFNVAGEAIHAACHMHCSLWPGLAEPSPGAEPLYHGGGGEGPTAAIEGLTSTPGGEVLGFVEHDPVVPAAVEVVLMDGSTYRVVARHTLPVDSEPALRAATVSLSGDGQEVLVGLEAGPGAIESHLVTGALGKDPGASRLNVGAVVGWLHPAGSSR